MKTIEQIVALYEERRIAAGPMRSRAIEVRDTYNGDLAVPLPELDEAERVAVANLAQLGIDQTSQRIASVMPAAFWPSMRPGQASERRARIRKETMRFWWEQNRIPLKMYRRARWLIAYASSPVMVRPGGEDMAMPMWQLREPLGAYPAPGDGDCIVPDDAIFTYRRDRTFLTRRFPNEMAMLRKARATSFVVVEYVDAEEIVALVIGAPEEMGDDQFYWSAERSLPGDGTAPEVEIIRAPNRTDRPLAVCPGRITLDKPIGQYDGMIGMYQMQAKMMALNVIATQRAIFPDLWLIGDGATTPEVITESDPITGRVGKTRGGKLDVVRMDPGVFTNPLLDRIEYAERHTAGIPAEFGGSSTTNIRTGRRGDAVLSAVIDFPIQEAQRILEASLEAENKIAVAIAKTYGGRRSFSMYVGTFGRYDLVPERDFETDIHYVRYAYAGADADRLTIAGLQRIGAQTLSKRSYMEIDPLVEDPEQERDRIQVEALEAAFLNSIQTQAADPNGPYQPVDIARLLQLVREDKANLPDAVMQVQREAQARQARLAPPAPAGMATAPEAQPGLSPLGAGIEAAAPIPDAGPSIGNLSQLFTQLRRPQMALGPERMPTPAETGAAGIA